MPVWAGSALRENASDARSTMAPIASWPQVGKTFRSSVQHRLLSEIRQERERLMTCRATGQNSSRAR